MKTRNNKVGMGSMLLILVLSIVLAGCGGGNQSGSSGSGNKENTAGQSEAPTEISLMLPSSQATPPRDGNPVQLELEKRTNTKIHFQWVAGAYEEKANVTLASGELPDMMTIKSPDITGNIFRTLTSQGAFWDLTPYIKDFPNMSKLPDEIWDKIKLGGKIYGIPRPRSIEGATFFTVRKDWLDNLGLDMPTNQEEMYEVWRAFTYDDPDQNGKQDTIGFAGTLNHLGTYANVFTQASGIYGSVGAKWKLQDGELISTALLPSLREALVVTRKVVEEKLVPEDAATIKDDQVKNLFISGKAGMKLDKMFSIQTNLDTLLQIDPDAEIVPIPMLNNYNPQDLGFLNMIAISKEVPEGKLIKLLEFLDYGLSDEAYELSQWGVKDIHYTETNGVRTKTDLYTTDSINDYINLLYRYDKYGNTINESMPKEMQEEFKKVIDLKETTSVPDYSYGLYSESYLKLGSELDKKLDDMKTRVLLGMETMEAWDAFVEELKSNPDLIKITEELNASLKERGGK